MTQRVQSFTMGLYPLLHGFLFRELLVELEELGHVLAVFLYFSLHD